MSLTAKEYERIAKRSRIVNTEETKQLLLDDAINSIQKEVNKEGHTGKLGSPDGILRGKPQFHKGFFIQIFGMKKYENELDIFGSLKWFGWAVKKTMFKGKQMRIEFSVDSNMPMGFDTEHEAGAWLFKLVDLYQSSIKN